MPSANTVWQPLVPFRRATYEMVVFALDPWVLPLWDRINDYLKRKLLVISCIEVYPLRKRPVGSAFLFLVRYTTFRASPLQVVVELRLHSA
jgi:hypothetical protein